METTDCLSKEKLSLIEEVKDRIMRQTLEALLYEEVIEAVRTDREWLFTGKSSEGSKVHYSCRAEEKWSFGRIKVEPNSINREGTLCTDLYVFLEEVIQNHLEGAYTAQFIYELIETLAKDYQSKEIQVDQIPEQDRHYEALESHMVDGHPYHPSYKSRIGFSLADNGSYGPEFNQEVSVYWVAVNEKLVDVSISTDHSFDEIYKQHVTDQDQIAFEHILKEQEARDKKYIFLPVHPWQFEHRLKALFIQQIADKDIIVLGASTPFYRAQQSIRSLSHRTNPSAPYIKLSLSMTNTSTSRILAQHTTQNAPLISDWLQNIIKHDPLLKKEGFQILREIMGISYRYDSLTPVHYRLAYGTLGAIYRENISIYLEEQEEAWPLNAIQHVQKMGSHLSKTRFFSTGLRDGVRH